MRGWLRENAYTGLRIAIGLILLWHGIPRALGGFELWQEVGGKLLTPLDIERFHTAAGFLVAYCEVLGGGGLVLGFMFYPAVVMAFVCYGAKLGHSLHANHLARLAAEQEGLAFVHDTVWQALGLVLLLLVYFAISGPGPWAVDNLLLGRRRWRLTQRTLPRIDDAAPTEIAPPGYGEDGEGRTKSGRRKQT